MSRRRPLAAHGQDARVSSLGWRGTHGWHECSDCGTVLATLTGQQAHDRWHQQLGKLLQEIMDRLIQLEPPDGDDEDQDQDHGAGRYDPGWLRESLGQVRDILRERANAEGRAVIHDE